MYGGSRKVEAIARVGVTGNEAGRPPATHGESHGVEPIGIHRHPYARGDGARQQS